MISMFQ